MGCTSSQEVKKVVSHIKQQEKKIDDLIEMNKVLQQKIKDFQMHSASEGKHSTETNDLTNLIDARFTKLEKTVGMIHHEFKTKLFEGVTDNLEMDEAAEKPEKSLTLNFANERAEQRNSNNKSIAKDPEWKDLLEDSEMTKTETGKPKPYPQPNASKNIQVNFRRPSKGFQAHLRAADHNDIRIDMK